MTDPQIRYVLRRVILGYRGLSCLSGARFREPAYGNSVCHYYLDRKEGGVGAWLLTLEPTLWVIADAAPNWSSARGMKGYEFWDAPGLLRRTNRNAERSVPPARVNVGNSIQELWVDESDVNATRCHALRCSVVQCGAVRVCLMCRMMPTTGIQPVTQGDPRDFRLLSHSSLSSSPRDTLHLLWHRDAASFSGTFSASARPALSS
ncbi:hypothetical protein BKA56DRAFT_282166 [Ilyonectria sp. MPI-CAGE-AT-0026]|nr:hypothetical protein BKA56DRAFT_282166 [Ilyonectria sp. MPI-CAGE-AT-0026]